MKIADAKVGMRIRPTGQGRHDYEIVEIFERVVEVRSLALRCRVPDDQNPGQAHWSIQFARDGHELYDYTGTGDIFYEPVEWPGLMAEKIEREAMIELTSDGDC